MRWLNDPTPASPRMATGGPPTPFFRTMLMTPPIALSPYSTAPLLPRVISMRSIESRGMVEKSTPAISMSLSLSAVDEDQRVGGREGAEAAEIDAGLRAVDAAEQARELHARHLRDDLLQRLRGRMRDLFGGDDGRGCADDAGELPAAVPPPPCRALCEATLGRSRRRIPLPVDGVRLPADAARACASS